MNNVDAMSIWIAELFRRRLDHCKDWPQQRLLDWVKWFVIRQRYLVSVRGGKLDGVCLWRRVDNEANCREEYCDTGGAVLYVDAMIANSAGALKKIYTEGINGPVKDCDTMAWVRPKHNNKIICVPMEKARRRLIKE